MSKNSSSGNALFLILIAVALFAALSYAVTQSGRGGGSIDREQASINAAIIMQYAGTVERAIQRMKLLNGTQDEDFSFDTPEWGFTGYQHGVAQPDENKVFSDNGGGVTWRDFTALGGVLKYSANNAILGVGSCDTNTGAACKELLMMIYENKMSNMKMKAN